MKFEMMLKKDRDVARNKKLLDAKDDYGRPFPAGTTGRSAFHPQNHPSTQKIDGHIIPNMRNPT
jgi:hypothetical protein